MANGKEALSPETPPEAVEVSDSRRKSKSSSRSSFAGSPLNPNISINLEVFIMSFPWTVRTDEHRCLLEQASGPPKVMFDLYISYA